MSIIKLAFYVTLVLMAFALPAIVNSIGTEVIQNSQLAEIDAVVKDGLSAGIIAFIIFTACILIAFNRSLISSILSIFE